MPIFCPRPPQQQPHPPHPTPPHTHAPQEAKRDFAKLLRDASEGLPVAGRPAVWEAGRPTVVHGAQKPRGFITYERRRAVLRGLRRWLAACRAAQESVPVSAPQVVALQATGLLRMRTKRGSMKVAKRPPAPPPPP